MQVPETGEETLAWVQNARAFRIRRVIYFLSVVFVVSLAVYTHLAWHVPLMWALTGGLIGWVIGVMFLVFLRYMVASIGFGSDRLVVRYERDRERDLLRTDVRKVNWVEELVVRSCGIYLDSGDKVVLNFMEKPLAEKVKRWLEVR